MARFLVSYLIVVPLAALLLLLVRRFSWTHLLGAVGATWGCKLVVTSLLYYAVARGTATRLDPIRATPQPMNRGESQSTQDYRPADGAFAAGDIAGRVRSGSHGVPGAVVQLVSPAPGRAGDGAEALVLTITGSHYDQPLAAIQVSGSLTVRNRDAVLHTLHMDQDHGTGGRTLWNRPLPPGNAITQRAPSQPGRYHLRCDNHPNEQAWIVTVDHPYVTTTGPDGSFRLAQVPVGEHLLITLAVVDAKLIEQRRTLSVRAKAETRSEIDLMDASMRHTRAPSGTPDCVAAKGAVFAIEHEVL